MLNIYAKSFMTATRTDTVSLCELPTQPRPQARWWKFHISRPWNARKQPFSTLDKGEL